MNNAVVDKHLAIIQEFHQASLGEMNSNARDELNVSILDLRKATRWYQTSVPSQIEEIWDGIRNNIRLLDYVMDGTSALQLYGLENDTEEQKLIEKIAHSWGWASRTCSSDVQLKERAPNIDFCRTQLRQNAWLIFVYLLQYLRQV